MNTEVVEGNNDGVTIVFALVDTDKVDEGVLQCHFIVVTSHWHVTDAGWQGGGYHMLVESQGDATVNLITVGRFVVIMYLLICGLVLPTTKNKPLVVDSIGEEKKESKYKRRRFSRGFSIHVVLVFL